MTEIPAHLLERAEAARRKAKLADAVDVEDYPVPEFAVIDAQWKREIDELEAKRAAFDKQRDVIALADILHSTECSLSHTDQCGWDRDTWIDYLDKPYSAKRRWVERAEKIMLQSAYGPKTIIGVLKLVHGK